MKKKLENVDLAIQMDLHMAIFTMVILYQMAISKFHLRALCCHNVVGSCCSLQNQY